MRPPSEADFAAAAITDASELRLAHEGPDGTCGYCGSNNRAGAAVCGSCGGARAAAAGGGGRVRAQVLAAIDEREDVEAAIRPKRGRWGRRLRILAVAGAGAGGLGYWGFSEHDLEARLSRLEWEHTTHLEGWQDVRRGQWGRVSARPGKAPVGGAGEVAAIESPHCYDKHARDERYACGSESYRDTESYTCGTRQECSTRSNANGSFTRTCRSVSKTCTRSVTKTRTKYCTRPIYELWCDYTTQEWAQVREKTVRGEGHEGLRFDDFGALADDQRTTQSGRYALTFTYDDDQTYRAEVPRGEYDAWSIGERAILSFERLRGVTGYRRPRAGE